MSSYITLFKSIQFYVGLVVLHGIFPYILHFHFEYGECMRIFYGIFSVPDNTFMDMNNVMYVYIKYAIYQS